MTQTSKYNIYRRRDNGEETYTARTNAANRRDALKNWATLWQHQIALHPDDTATVSTHDGEYLGEYVARDRTQSNDIVEKSNRRTYMHRHVVIMEAGDKYIDIPMPRCNREEAIALVLALTDEIMSQIPIPERDVGCTYDVERFSERMADLYGDRDIPF